MDDVALLQYTVGTTGVSKRAMLTHTNMSHNAQQVGSWAALPALIQLKAPTLKYLW